MECLPQCRNVGDAHKNSQLLHFLSVAHAWTQSEITLREIFAVEGYVNSLHLANDGVVLNFLISKMFRV